LKKKFQNIFFFKQYQDLFSVSTFLVADPDLFSTIFMGGYNKILSIFLKAILILNEHAISTWKNGMPKFSCTHFDKQKNLNGEVRSSDNKAGERIYLKN